MGSREYDLLQVQTVMNSFKHFLLNSRYSWVDVIAISVGATLLYVEQYFLAVLVLSTGALLTVLLQLDED